MNRKLWRSEWLICALLVMIALLICSCSAKPYGPAYGRDTQPTYLYLPAGQPYIPKVAEKWVSPQVIEEKDQMLLEQNRILERAGLQPYLPK